MVLYPNKLPESERVCFGICSYPVDMICKCIKWLFIEQDITYWNWSGRNMLYNGIKNV